MKSFRIILLSVLDDALVATLQQWRIQPRTVYKLYVPVKIHGGQIHLGSTQAL